MSKTKSKKGQDKRIPASKLNLEFNQANELVLVMDEVSVLHA